MKCRCGYDATDSTDLDEHILAVISVDDGANHGEA